MKQCPNCRCQVEVQAKVCPYCGITLPLYRHMQEPGEAYSMRTKTTVRQGFLSGNSRKADYVETKSADITQKQEPRRSVRSRTSREERLLHKDYQIIILLMTANLIVGLAQLLVQLIVL